MTIVPEEGDTVYVPDLDEVVKVAECIEEWVLIYIDGKDVAKRADELVIPSKHGKSRWRKRMWDDCDVPREMAERWASGVVLNHHGMHGDEVRLDTDSGAVMVLNENAIATVIDPAGRKDKLETAICEVSND